MRESLSRRIAKWVLTVLIVVTAMLPIAWMMIAGFKGRNEVLRTPFQFFPEIWRWENYTQIAADPEFLRAILVTFVAAVIFTVLSLTVNSFAAYVFARLEFVGKRFWWIYCITPMFVPGMAILLTSFIVVTNLGMLDTLAVLIVPGIAASGQMFFIRQFYLNIPISMEEAALIDGASRWKIFWQIFLPQSQGPFVVVGFGSFIGIWNSYIWPILTIQNPDLRLIMRYLAEFRTERTTDWGMLMAGSALAALPVFVIVLIFQRYIVNGVRMAGIK